MIDREVRAQAAQTSTGSAAPTNPASDALRYLSLEIRHLRLVTAIAREGSLTKAGERLHLTQSALSHQLHEIEHRLGAAIYDRVRRRLVPTPMGQRLIAAAPGILGALVELERDLREHTDGRHGTLRVTLENYTCFGWLAPLLAVFSQAYPSVEVAAVIDQSGRPLEAVAEGRVDVALVKTPVDLDGLLATHLFQDELLLLVGNEHKLAERGWIEPDAMASERLLIHSDPERSRFYRYFLASAGVRPRQFATVAPTELTIGMVAAGLGVSALSNWAARDVLRRGYVTGLRLSKQGVQRTWLAVRREGKEPEYLRHFVSLLPGYLLSDSATHRPAGRSGSRRVAPLRAGVSR